MLSTKFKSAELLDVWLTENNSHFHTLLEKKKFKEKIQNRDDPESCFFRDMISLNVNLESRVFELTGKIDQLESYINDLTDKTNNDISCLSNLISQLINLSPYDRAGDLNCNNDIVLSRNEMNSKLYNLKNRY